MNIFKSVPLYIILKCNYIKVCRLDNGQCISRKAVKPFSNQRLVIADFQEVENFLKTTIKELISYKRFGPVLKIAIHQLELNEGGLSSVEKRTLRDCCAHLNAKETYIIEEKSELKHTIVIEHMRQNN